MRLCFPHHARIGHSQAYRMNLFHPSRFIKTSSRQAAQFEKPSQFLKAASLYTSLLIYPLALDNPFSDKRAAVEPSASFLGRFPNVRVKGFFRFRVLGPLQSSIRTSAWRARLEDVIVLCTSPKYLLASSATHTILSQHTRPRQLPADATVVHRINRGTSLHRPDHVRAICQRV